MSATAARLVAYPGQQHEPACLLSVGGWRQSQQGMDLQTSQRVKGAEH